MPEIVPALFALFALLLGVSLLMPLADRLSLPATMLLAAFGLALGLLASLVPPDLGLIGTSQPVGDVLSGLGQLGLDTEAFLYIFLPPLLFAAGITVDLRLMLDEIGAVLVMAVVAVLVCIGFVGFALDAFSEFGLVVCLLLGAIVATTDPSAVLAIFGDIGAPRRLRGLVAGESLFNDAAAIALFAIFFEMLAGFRAPELSRGLIAFATDFAGGVALGYLLARGAAALLNYLRERPAAAITVSVSLAYLAYILGESYLGVSGVIAVVTAALTTAIYGPVRLAPAAWRGLLRIWEQLEFWANSLIFVLASMLAVKVLASASWGDFGLLAVLVVAALAARAFVLQLLLPLLTAVRLVQPIDQKYRAVILWGGLRGAVTLALALSVANDPRVFPEAQHFIAVLATGFVFFTLFVSAPTLKPLLQLLGLDRLSPTEQALRDRVWELSRGQIREQVKATAEEYGFAPELAENLAIGETSENPVESESLTSLSEAEREAVGLLALATQERELY
ncbi:MAG: cation:proton antiporter, partial [Rhodovibrionaceae bacterium]